MDFDYEADLNRLKEQQKQQAIAELEKQKNQSLSDLNAEEQTVKPTYYKKKDTANVQNQVSARNFHEYLVNSGRSNSGIGAQYEMSRKNTLQRNLNDINLEEAGVLSDIARRRTDVNNAYNTGLTGANAQIEADYIQNLLTQRQAAWERQQQEKEYQESIRQFNENLALQQKQYDESVRQFNENLALQKASLYRSSGSGGSSRRSSGGSSSSQSSLLEWKPNSAYTATRQGNYITYTDKTDINNKMTVPAGYNPFTGTRNDDVNNGTFSNGYQPNNIEGQKLTKAGTTTYNGQEQTVWKTSDGTKWVWNGRTNNYEYL